MLQTRRNVIRITRRTASRQQRRYDSSKTGSGHAASPSHHSSHPKPVNESLGRGFYIAIAVIPLSFVLYKYSVSSNDGTADSAQPVLTRLIDYYGHWDEEWARRNTLHTAAYEQAAHDRNLFQSSPASQHIELKFPEIFNTGSPHNVPAGHGANLDELIAHYKRQNAEANEAIEKRMRAAESKNKDP